MIGVLCVAIGLYAGPFRNAAENAAQAALNVQGYIDAIIQ
jgi:hypothetical protein